MPLSMPLWVLTPPSCEDPPSLPPSHLPTLPPILASSGPRSSLLRPTERPTPGEWWSNARRQRSGRPMQPPRPPPSPARAGVPLQGVVEHLLVPPSVPWPYIAMPCIAMPCIAMLCRLQAASSGAKRCDSGDLRCYPHVSWSCVSWPHVSWSCGWPHGRCTSGCCGICRLSCPLGRCKPRCGWHSGLAWSGAGGNPPVL